jgi:hypothetical protein
VALLAILVAWGWQQGADVISMKGVDPAHRGWRWAARILLLGMIGTTCWLIRKAWKQKTEAGP